jgi:hypothetical protein
LAADVAVISVGTSNTHGHPRQDVVTALTARGAKVLCAPAVATTIAGRYPDEQVYVCRPSEPAADYRTVPIPSRHRQLFPGETVRRGDKYIDAQTGQWQEVRQRMLGATVPQEDVTAAQLLDQAEPSLTVRFCRPAHPGMPFRVLRRKPALETACRSASSTNSSTVFPCAAAATAAC